MIQENERNTACLIYFIKQFMETLESGDASIGEISRSIRGIGSLAKPTKKYIQNAEDRNKLLNTLLSKATFLYSE